MLPDLLERIQTPGSQPSSTYISIQLLLLFKQTVFSSQERQALNTQPPPSDTLYLVNDSSLLLRHYIKNNQPPKSLPKQYSPLHSHLAAAVLRKEVYWPFIFFPNHHLIITLPKQQLFPLHPHISPKKASPNCISRFINNLNEMGEG